MTRKGILAAKRQELQRELEGWATDPQSGITLARDEIMLVEIGIKKQSAPLVKVAAMQKWHEELGTRIPEQIWKKLFAVPWGHARRMMFYAFRTNNNQPLSAIAIAEITGMNTNLSRTYRDQTNRSLKEHGIPLRLKSLVYGPPYDKKLYHLVMVRDLSPRPPAAQSS